MKIAVVNAHQPNYEPLAKLTTYGNRAEYCKRHGYDLKVMTDGWKMPAIHPVTWDRFLFARNLLRSYDWIYICGTDTLHTNFKIRLQHLMVPGKHVIFSAEWCAPLQADSFLVRNSKEGTEWMDYILSLYPKYKDDVWVEQAAAIAALPQWQEIIATLPQRRMNSYDYTLYLEMYPDMPGVKAAKDIFGNDGQWQVGDFLIHWPGLPLKQRLGLAAHYLTQVVK